jgi:hypothetical protein
MNVAREACLRYEPEFVARCTLVTSVEPCCMCSGGAYWAGIGTVVYGLTERRLAELTGDNPENLTLDMPCREVFDAGRRHVELRGPYPELEAEIIAAHKSMSRGGASFARSSGRLKRQNLTQGLSRSRGNGACGEGAAMI